MPFGKFEPGTQVQVQAPPEVVFGLLRDRSTWSGWNSFVPKAELVRAAPGENHEDPHQLQFGQRLRFSVQVEMWGNPTILPIKTVEEIVLLEDPGASSDSTTRRVDWKQRMLPAFLLRTLRVNEVTVDELEGNGCTYRTSMIFEGPLAGPVKWFAGSMVQHGLEQCAQGLKNAAEQYGAH